MGRQQVKWHCNSHVLGFLITVRQPGETSAGGLFPKQNTTNYYFIVRRRFGYLEAESCCNQHLRNKVMLYMSLEV